MNLSFDELLSQCPEELVLRIKNLKNVPQRADFHPEGSVFRHSEVVTNRLAKYREPILSWSGIFHDIGKDETTKMDDKGILHAVDHEIVSLQVLEKYIQHLPVFDDDGSGWDMVAEIVQMHMRIKLFDEMSLKKQLEMRRLKSFGYLQLFAIADDMSTLTKEEIENKIKYPKRLVFEVATEPGSSATIFYDIQKEEVKENVEPEYFFVGNKNGLKISEIGKDGYLNGIKCLNFPIHVYNRILEENKNL